MVDAFFIVILVLMTEKNKTNKTGLNRVKNEFKRIDNEMQKEDFVKLGFDDEVAKKCADASAEELKGYIPKVRFDAVNNDKKKLELSHLRTSICRKISIFLTKWHNLVYNVANSKNIKGEL